MSMSVSVTAKDNQRIRLVIDNPDAYTITSVLRSDAAGTRSVRLLDGDLPTTDTELIVLDYEYSLVMGDTITYTVTATDTATDTTVTATLELAEEWANTTGGLLHIAVPLNPQAAMDLAGPGAPGAFISTWRDNAAAGTTLHQVIGRRDPLPVLRAAATRTGEFVVVCPSLQVAQALQDLLGMAQVFQLRQSDQQSLDLYFVPTDVGLEHSEANWTTSPRPERRWSVRVAFTETGWPIGPTVPATVWTYQDLADAYDDYASVAAAFDTYVDLLERTPRA